VLEEKKPVEAAIDLIDDATTSQEGQPRIARYASWLLLLLCLLPFLLTAYAYYHHSHPQGDEPHYLVISQTMWLYHSIDVMKDYNHQDYLSFYPVRLDPHISTSASGQVLPLHSIGGPFLWLIPFALGGRLGTLFFVCLLSALTVLNIYLLLLAMGIQRRYAFGVGLAFALGSPIYVYSHLTFVEPLAALICIYVMRIICQPTRRTGDLIGASLALGLLHWIHIRFALVEMVLFGFLLVRLYLDSRANSAGQFKRYAAYLLPFVALFLLFELYNLTVWGTLNPAANQASAGKVPFLALPFTGIIGIFFDQEFGLFTNFPLFAFALPGILLTLKRKYLTLNLLLLALFVPYVIMVASFDSWAGGWGPPARFILVLTPTLAFPVAYALQRAGNIVLNGFFALCALFAAIIGVAYIWANKSGFNGGHGASLAMLYVQKVSHIIFTPYIPSLFQPHQKPLFLAWLAALLALTLGTWLLVRWKERKSVLLSRS
jgi:hypothetical protein